MRISPVKYLLLFLGLISGLIASAQLKMPVVVNSDTTLARGTYLLDKNLLVSKDASLRFAPGSHLLLSPRAVIRIEGGFEMQGDEQDFSSISSQHPEMGTGLIVSGTSSKKILFKKVRFQGLTTPLEFGPEWHRPLVSINTCEFKENISYLQCIFVRIPGSVEISDPAKLEFIGNSYIDNTGGIYFESIDEPNFEIVVKDNLVYGNKAYGAGMEGMLTSPFFIRSDIDGSTANMVFTGNALYKNLIRDSEFDTINKEVNFGAAGGASTIKLTGNYFGPGTAAENSAKFDHFSNNKEAPFVDISPKLNKLPEGMVAMVKTIEYNSTDITHQGDLAIEPTPEVELTVTFTEAVDMTASSPKVGYVGFDEVAIKEVSGTLDTETQWLDDRTVVFKSRDNVLTKVKRIFFSFKGFKSKKKFSVPSHSIGENGYYRYVAENFDDGLKNFANKRTKGIKSGVGEQPVDMELIDSLMKAYDSIFKLMGSINADNSDKIDDLQKKEELELIRSLQYKGSYEFGAYIGQSTYFGDLTGGNFIDIKDANLCLGLEAKYNFNQRFSLAGTFTYGSLQGQEGDNSIRTSPYTDRGFSFTSKLYELSFHGHYNLNKIGISGRGRFTPALSLGIGAFHFNPYADNPLDNEWNDQIDYISLYDYNTAGLSQPYSRYAYCIPFGIHLKTIVKKTTLVDFFVTWRFTGTDMLDNVGNPSIYKNEAAFRSLAPTGNYKEFSKSDIAFAIHQSQNPDKYYRPGKDRGGHVNNDWYVIWGVSLSYINLREVKYKLVD